MPKFSHLHCHTQFSLLDGAAKIPDLINKAKIDGQPAVAITDHGNMFGAFHFVNQAQKAGVKPIVGCEFYLVEDRHRQQFSRGEKDIRHHQLLLAKNQIGYQNLSKLCSLGYMEGLYGKYPRIDKSLLVKYKEGIIATSCCIGAEIPQTILKQGKEAAEQKLKWWLEQFGSDYFIEIQRHGLKNIDNTGMSQEDVNQILIGFAKKNDLNIIATNDSHYTEEEDFNAHDILLCVNTGDFKNTPIGQGKGYRFGFPNNQFFFKTTEQMNALFSDIPESIDNTNLLIDRIEAPKINRDILLPNFSLPKGFNTQDDYLRYLVYEGAKKRYGEMTEDLRERIDFELATISNSGYPGYFLIVQDFTSAARKLNVSVGPGRGSAAGSVVAYCTGITNVDPIKYDLLFERFLNPERISMPDIDIDFDDRGREKVIDYVIDKYGKNCVSQIITYGSMAAKSSIRDVGRVLELPLDKTGDLAKLVPDGGNLNKIFKMDDKELKEKFRSEEFENIKKLKSISHEKKLEGQVIKDALKLEGSVRNTGVHACGIIITPDDITNHIPIAKAKGTELLITQYDNDLVENAGLLKMDFLGLKTLTIIKDCIALIKKRHQTEIDIDTISLEDENAFKIFRKGLTNGIFQFESDGMKAHLKSLKPTQFNDIIAMAALYRPGPMEYIPTYIKRKHGKETIHYDHPDMEEYLKETYGITVYQEQVMLLSQKLASFSKGQADKLRKAMGKKKKEDIDAMKPVFMENAEKNGYDQKIMEKVWGDWEAFASYAFNKSHSTCYAVVAFQTAYLKGNYTPEFMASLLTHNMSNMDKMSKYIEECKFYNIEVLGPDLNESEANFSVNNLGKIRFGLEAIKGVGGAAVEKLIEERQKNGPFTSIFDLTSRVDLRSINKKTLTSMATAGCFDSFSNTHRAQYISEGIHEDSGVELAVKFGAKAQGGAQKNQSSLFGENAAVQLTQPKLPECEELTMIQRLNLEKEVIGMYISGHPLLQFNNQIQFFCNAELNDLEEQTEKKLNKEFIICGIVTKFQEGMSRKGDKYCHVEIEDFKGSFSFRLYSDDFAKFSQYLHEDDRVAIKMQLKKYYSNDRFFWKIAEVVYLSDVFKKYLGKVEVHLKTDAVSLPLIDQLERLHTERGKIGFDIKLTQKKTDEESKKNYHQSINLRSAKIKLSNEELAWIDTLKEKNIPFKMIRN